MPESFSGGKLPLVITRASPDVISSPPEALANLQRHAEIAAGAFAAETVRALKADTNLFARWCAERGFCALPASPEVLAAFVDSMAETRAPASVSRYVSSISHLHKAAKAPNPADAIEVGLALRRMRRARGVAQRQAGALNRRAIDKMIRAAPDTLRGQRDKALLAVAYDSLCRRSELVRMEVAHFELSASTGDGSVLVPRSKTDQTGRGSLRWIGPDTARLLRDWLRLAGIEAGPVFRSIHRSGRVGGPLGPEQVGRLFREMGQGAGLAPEMVERISGHSVRIGAAQDQVAAGVELPAVMVSGGWKSATMVSRYAARLEVRKGGAAQLAARQRRR